MYLPGRKKARQKESHGLRVKAPIAAVFEDCIQAFARLADSLQVSQCNPEWYRTAHDCTLRFKLWGERSGANSRILDYVLRRSPSIKRQVVRLLEELSDALKEALDRASLQPPGSASDRDANDRSLALFAPNSANVVVEAVLDDPDAETGIEVYLEEIEDIIGFLIQLLAVLRDPLHEADRATSQHDDTYSAEAFRRLAGILFPNTEVDTRRKLGEQNQKRWRNLGHTMMGTRLLGAQSGSERTYQRKFAPWDVPFRPINAVFIKESNPDGLSMIHSEIDASTVCTHADTILERTVVPDDSVTSGTDPQPTILKRLILPPPPTELPCNTPQRCGYCHFEIPLAFSSIPFDEAQWSTHIFADLAAYSCTHEGCVRGNRPFSDKREWIQHELDHHRTGTVWYCGACRIDFDVPNSLLMHIKSVHTELSSHEQAFVHECKRYTPGVLPERGCSLCGIVCNDVEDMECHIGKHLELFALAALMNEEVPDEEIVESNDMIMDYIEELPEPHRDHEGKSVQDAIMGNNDPYQMASVDMEISSHMDDTVDAFDADDIEDISREVPNKSWDDRFVSFLDGQPEPGSIKPLYSNHRSRYDNFVGRDVDLQAIRRCLLPGKIVTLSGRGGIGKTALAVEYFHTYESDFSYIFWVEAEDSGLCAEQYALIADTLKLKQKPLADADTVTYQIRETLVKIQARFLLIFDNVDSWVNVSRYMPRNLPLSQGSVLITTRNGPILEIPDWYPAFHHQHAVQLKPWPREHAREFLLTATQPNCNKDNLQDHVEYETAAKIVDAVGGLPLAISMIVGYVKVSKTDLGEFLEMWEEKEHTVNKTRRNRGVDVNENDIDATIDSLWTIGIREVRMNSRRLLDIVSFLDSETIPKSLLVGDHTEEYLEFLNASETLSYKRMSAELINRRLWQEKKTSTGEVAYTIHRLLQYKVLQDMEDYGFADSFRKVFRLLRKRFPSADALQLPKPTQWDIGRQFLPHIASLRRIYNKNVDAAPAHNPDPTEIAELFYDAGYHIWTRQSTAYDGLDYLQTASRILDDVSWDPNAKLRADILCVHGLLLLNMGCVERRQASDILDNAWQIRRRIHDQHPNHNNDVLFQNAANDYALCLLNDHQFEKAGGIFKQCREQYLKWAPEEHNPFENSKYYGNFSIVLMWRGAMDEAIRYQEHAIKLIRSFSGTKASYWRKKFMLACILLQAEDFQGALDLHLDVLKARLDLHGEQDEYTISSMYAVGAMYHHLGDLSVATGYIEQSIEFEKSAWWDRAALCRACLHLSLLYREQGIKRDEAVKLELQAEELLEKFGHYAAKSVRETKDKLMIFDDLQPTFLGRYTGQKLLKHLQTSPEFKQASIS